MYPTAIIVGFENNAFTVQESVGTFDVYVIVTRPPVDVQLYGSVDLVIQTTALTASKQNNDSPNI